MVDYREDMRISDDMIRRVAEAYRKVRNTIRYLLSNLSDFDPAQDAVAGDALDELDAYMLARHRQVVARVLEAYEAYEFHLVYHQLVQYAAADLSSFYLDVLKDRLYCDAPTRRGAARRRPCSTGSRATCRCCWRRCCRSRPTRPGRRCPGAPRARCTWPLPRPRGGRRRRGSTAGRRCSTCAPR